MADREAPPPPQTAAEVLDRARALFGLADHELMLALLPGIRDRASDLGTDDHYRRAKIMAALANAGAAVTQAMLVTEDEEQLVEFDRHLGPYPTPLGRPPAPPNADPPHPFIRQQPASNTHCRFIVSTGRACNRPPDDLVHQQETADAR